MHFSPEAVEHAVSPVDLSELTTYKNQTAFNLFLFSRRENDQPLFLLHKSAESSIYEHFSGELSAHDPAIVFAITREVITKTSGLLHSKNLEHFTITTDEGRSIDESVLTFDFVRPVRMYRCLDDTPHDICKQLTECPYIFQDNSGEVTYFVEVPMLDVYAMNKVAKNKNIDFEAKYYTIDEVCGKCTSDVSDKLTNCLADVKLFNYMNKFVINNEPIVNKEYYAFIACDPVFNKATVPALFCSTFKKHGEHWKLYKAYENELPSEEDLQRFTGVIIPGSGHSAYERNVPWFAALFKCIQNISNNYKHINLLGVCFGSQVIAQALGGQVAKMESGFYRGGESLKVKPTLFELEYIKKLELEVKDKLVITKVHGDYIVEAPPGATVHASSGRTDVEIYTIGDNVLAMQGHPEYNEPWIAGTNLILNKLVKDNYDEYAEEFIREKFPEMVCREKLLKVCYSFLKRNRAEILTV